MTRDQLMESLLHLPHPWPRPETECSLPTDNGHGDLEGWIKGPTNNEWHYAWVGAHERRIVITREQWEEALLAHVQHLERPASADEVDPGDWNGPPFLPPVGCVCEANYCEEWRKCEVLALFKQPAGMVAAFIVDCGNGVMSLDAYGADCFRPIRTDREKAIEEMKQITKAAADAHKRELHGALSEEYLLGALYDAGHRKVKS